MLIKHPKRQITVESSTDRRIKISSMANRLHLHAPSVSEVRNQVN